MVVVVVVVVVLWDLVVMLAGHVHHRKRDSVIGRWDI